MITLKLLWCHLVLDFGLVCNYISRTCNAHVRRVHAQVKKEMGL